MYSVRYRFLLMMVMVMLPEFAERIFMRDFNSSAHTTLISPIESSCSALLIDCTYTLFIYSFQISEYFFCVRFVSIHVFYPPF